MHLHYVGDSIVEQAVGAVQNKILQTCRAQPDKDPLTRSTSCSLVNYFARDPESSGGGGPCPGKTSVC